MVTPQPPSRRRPSGKPRWPNGPEICPNVNLPAFNTEKEMSDFIASFHGTIMAKWQCKECGKFHCWTKPHSPGGDSGRQRDYAVPDWVNRLTKG